MFQKFGLLLFLGILMSSCVTHKSIVYFQGDSLSDRSIREINNKPYRLQVDDIIRIDIKASNSELVNVFKTNSLRTSSNQVREGGMYFSGYSVDKRGAIELPYLNKINVLGYTTEEVAVKVKEGLSKYFKDLSDIFVSVKLAGVKYTIIGEVGSPGSKVLFQNTVNIVEAIANSGDISLTGDRRNVELLRIGVDGVKKYHIDLTQMEAFNSEIFYIQPNDIINVLPIKQKTLGTGVIGTQTFSTVMSLLSVLTTTYLLIKSL